MAECVIRETYEIITQESAENGDAEERGWIDEEGSTYTLREAVSLLRGTEPSSTRFHEGIWYTNYGDQDWQDGSYENRSYHVVGTRNFQRKLYYTLRFSKRR